jgi:hypothetical protein
MRRYIVLLLITGIVWAQTDFDKLVLKDGTTLLGEYSKIEGDRVYFKNHAIPILPAQPVLVKLIQTLKLKDGQIIILNGKDILAYEEYQKDSLDEYKKLSILEEYQKLRTEEKAIFVGIIGCIIVVAVIVATADFSFSTGSGFGPGLI